MTDGVGAPPPLAAHAARASAAAAARRPHADATPGEASAEGGRRERTADSAPRIATGAPDPSGQSGRLVDVFA